MMLKILLLAFIVGTVSASVAIGPLLPKPSEFAHKEGCYIEEINDVIPFGDEITPIGYCLKILCGSTSMQYISCGAVASDRNNPDCYVSGRDMRKPFPDCCPKIKCII